MGPGGDRAVLSTGAGILAIVLWSGTFAIARSLSEQVGPLTGAAAVYLLGGALCLARLGWRSSSLRSLATLSRSYLLGCGLLFAAYTVTIYLAVGLATDRGQLLEVALVNYLWPSGTILLSLVLLRRRAGAWLLPGTALALVGVFLVMTQGARVSWESFAGHLRANPLAFVLALIAAAAWSLYSNLARRWTTPGSGGAVEVFVPVTGLILLVVRALRPESGTWTAKAVIEAGVLGGITTLAYVLWDVAMREGDLPLVLACSYFTPLLSTLVSAAYLGVMPRSSLWAGCLLIVAGSLVSWRSVSDPP
jgi:drug/metabolite transporter (DMT)-like permease